MRGQGQGARKDVIDRPPCGLQRVIGCHRFARDIIAQDRGQQEMELQHTRRIALDQMLIEQLPLIVEKAAGALAGSNLTVLNGAEGVSEVVTGLLGQGIAIFDSVKKGLAVTQPDGAAPASTPAITTPPRPAVTEPRG